MYSKLHLTIGDKEIDVKLSGINKLNQIHTMKGLICSFFDELQAEISAEEKKLLEEKETRFLSNALGIKEEDLTSMVEAFSNIQPVRVERSAADLLSEEITSNNKDEPKPWEQDQKEKIVNEIHYKKDTPSGEKLFQTYYICPDCRFKGKLYIKRQHTYVHCKDCGNRMNIKPAAPGPFPHVDAFGNVFIAGKFIRADQYEPMPTTMAEKEEQEKKDEIYN